MAKDGKGREVKDKKWFQKAIMKKPPYNLDGWNKDQSAEKRRDEALRSRPKNWKLKKRYLSAERALQALANVTKDKETKEKALSDVKYFSDKRKGMKEYGGSMAKGGEATDFITFRVNPQVIRVEWRENMLTEMIKSDEKLSDNIKITEIKGDVGIIFKKIVILGYSYKIPISVLPYLNEKLQERYDYESEYGVDKILDSGEVWSLNDSIRKVVGAYNLKNKTNIQFDSIEEKSWKSGGSLAKGGKTEKWMQEAEEEMEKEGTVGLFTKKAKAHNMTTVQFAKEVEANPDKFDLKTRREAQFMINANPDLFASGGSMAKGGEVKKRLEYLRKELRAERISYGELAELQSLSKFIDPSDVELLEAAGVSEEFHNELVSWVEKNAPKQYHGASLLQIPDDVLNPKQREEKRQLLERFSSGGSMEKKKFYAVWAEGDYLESGYNSTSKEDLKNDILSLIEGDTDEVDFKKMKMMSADEIVEIKGWEIQEQDEPFVELDDFSSGGSMGKGGRADSSNSDINWLITGFSI